MNDRSPHVHQLGIVIFIAVIAVLYAAQVVFIPVALATLFAFLLTPVVNRLQRCRVGNVFSVLLVGGGLLLLVMGVFWLVAGQFSDLMTDFPKYQKNVREKMSALSDTRAAMLAGSVLNHTRDIAGTAPAIRPAPPSQADTSPSPAPNATPNPAVAVSSTRVIKAAPPTSVSPASLPHQDTRDDRASLRFSDVFNVLTSALHPLIEGGLVVLLTLFMLVRRTDLHVRFLVLSERVNDPSRQPMSAHAIDEAISTISRYLWMQSASNALIASIILCGLFILGVPNALLWGLLVFLLRFIPYLGIIIAAGSVFLFSIAVSPDWSTPLEVAILFFCSEMLFNSLLEPLFFSKGTGLSSIAILVAAIFWTWLWGTAGLFLSIPLTVCWMVIGKNYGHFAFLDILLGNRPLTAVDAVGGHAHMHSGPAPSPNERELHAALSEKASIPQVKTTMPSAGPTVASHTTATPSPSEPTSQGTSTITKTGALQDSAEATLAERPGILCIAADSDLDGLSCTMLCQMLDERNLATINPVDARPHDILTLISFHQIHAVCICALSGLSGQRARDWAQVLRLRFPDLFIVVGIWGTATLDQKTSMDQGDAALHIARTMGEAVDLLQSQPALQAGTGVGAA